MSMEIQLKKVEAAGEVEALCRVAKEAWEQAYGELLGPAQVAYMVEKFQSPAAVRAQMAQDGYQYYLIFGDGQPGGLVGFAPRYEGRDELFLSKLYLLPGLQGTGAARAALDFVEAEARRLGLPAIRLTVNKGNTHAAEVYRHFGFETVDAVVSDIGGGFVMDDYIMVKRLG